MRKFLEFYCSLSAAHQVRFLNLLQKAIHSPSITVSQKQLLEWRYRVILEAGV